MDADDFIKIMKHVDDKLEESRKQQQEDFKLMRAQLAEDFDTLRDDIRDMIKAAVPDGDLSLHRAYHQKLIDEAEKQKETAAADKRAARDRIIDISIGIIGAFVVAKTPILQTVWEWVK